MPRRSSEASNGDRSFDVLIVSQPAEYGVAIYVRQLAESAVQAGHDVTVISPSPREALGDLGHERRSPASRPRHGAKARPRDPFDLLTIRRLAEGATSSTCIRPRRPRWGASRQRRYRDAFARRW
jgi:hypothetical protein